MIAVALIAFIAAADVVRSAPALSTRRGGGWWVGAAFLAVGLTFQLGAGVDLFVVLGTAAAAVAWVMTMPARGPGESRRLWPAFALLVAVALAALVPGQSLAGPLVDAWQRTRLADAGIPLEPALGAIAVAVALTRTANLVTRSALARARRDDVGTRDDSRTPSARPADAERGWRLSVRGRDVAAVSRTASTLAAPLLRGGRLIGPLERLIVLVLGLAGAYPVIAAVLAAKGIVRFPEISADRAHGTKAEEFLIGSLVSWSTAGAGVLLVRMLLVP